MHILTVILNFIGNVFIGIFNKAMETEGEKHVVSEDKNKLEHSGGSDDDLIYEFRMHDRDKKDK